MAIAGGATTAYKVAMKDGKIKAERRTILAELCASPEEAMEALRHDDEATVQGSDMWNFWELAKAAGLRPWLPPSER